MILNSLYCYSERLGMWQELVFTVCFLPKILSKDSKMSERLQWQSKQWSRSPYPWLEILGVNGSCESSALQRMYLETFSHSSVPPLWPMSLYDKVSWEEPRGVWSLEAADGPWKNSSVLACLEPALHGLKAKHQLLGQQKSAYLLSWGTMSGDLLTGYLETSRKP